MSNRRSWWRQPYRRRTRTDRRWLAPSVQGLGAAGPALGKRYAALVEKQATQHQGVHVLAEEALERLFRQVHDRLAADVERGIEHHRHAGLLPEPNDQIV